LALDVKEVFSENGRTMVNGLSLSVELATEHLSGDRHLKYVTSELAMGMSVINISCAFENLDDGLSSSDLENLTLPALSITKLDVDDLRISSSSKK